MLHEVEPAARPPQLRVGVPQPGVGVAAAEAVSALQTAGGGDMLHGHVMFEICKIIPVTVYQLSALSRTLHLESSIPKTKQLCSVFNILICKPQY